MRKAALWSFALVACGDRAHGTVRGSAPLEPLDSFDASASAPPSSDAGGDDDADDAADASTGSRDAAPVPPTCSGKTAGAGDLTLPLTSGGYARTSLLHVPSSYDPTKAAMLVFDFHGFSSDAAQEVLLTHLNTVADARGFVVAHPYGLGNGWNAGDCCTEGQPANVDDVQFVKDLLALVASRWCIDPARVYATGMSNGGFLSHRLACAMSDVFAAVAPVAGVLGIPEDACRPARAVPVLHFHGTADPVVPYDGGPAAKLLPPIVFRSVDETIWHWRSTDACVGAPRVTYAKGDATCVRWSDCHGGADVEQCTIEGGGHTWPGGLPVPLLGKTSADLDASERMIDFFEAHPLSR